MNSDLAAPSTFKDRKTGLILFGLATTLLGGLCGLTVPFMILATLVGSRHPNEPAPSHLFSVAAVYGLLALILVWLGIGSVMTRRWARALLVIWSWSWFLFGLIACVILVLMAPQLANTIRAAQPTSQPQPSSSMQTMMTLVPIFIMASLFVALPLIWGLFYSGRNVKATCEARDPVVRWTDRSPLPVLAASLWLLFSAVSMLVAPALQGVAPFFGLLLSGIPGTILYLCMATVWSYGAWALYRLDSRGWWVVFIGLLLFAILNFVTYSRHDLSEVYALMGYSRAQIERMQALGFSGHSSLAKWSAFFVLPVLGYLYYIRKFFPQFGKSSSGILAP